jgi:LysW-gamma-L-lysine carboxypeptidase
MKLLERRMPSYQDPQLELLQRMVELYSPTGQESEIARFLVEQMANRGLSAWIDKAGNAIGEWGKGPVFLLCGHMDTVPGNLPIRIDGNKLFGRGAVDAKPALAAMLSSAEMLVKEEFPAKLIVVGTVDEEGNSRGIKYLLNRGINADYAIFGEPSGVDSITIAYKGSLHLKFTCQTDGGHSSSPWLSRSAVEEALEVWRELQTIHFSEEKPESKFHSLTSALKEIHGGMASSTIPSYCELHTDFRLPPAVSTHRLLIKAKEIVETHISNHEGVKIRMDVEDSNEPYEANTNSLLVRGLSWAIRDTLKKPATLLRKTGTGDMNIFGATNKVSVVTYGPGDSRLDHTSMENIDFNEYRNSIKILGQGLKRTLQIHKRMV